MNKILTLICTLLCTNILLAQSDAFLVGQLYYDIDYYNGNAVVYGYDFNNPPTDLVIPSTVTYYGTTYDVVGIDYAAFFYVYNGSMWVEMPCVSLTSVTIPNSVTDIGASAFSGCSNLVSVTIPDSVIYIKSSAFSGCSSLTSITIPNSVIYIGDDAFSGCSSLTSLSIDLTSVNNLSNTGLNTSILQNITFGENVTSIESGMFNTSAFLQNVTCLATTPPTLANNSTVFPHPNTATLTVPCGTLEVYSAPTSYWDTFFAGRISENGYDVVATANDITFGFVAVENNCSTATLTATANACYEFVSWNDGNTDNPRTINLVSDTSFTALFEEIEFDTELSATICEGTVYNDNGFNVSEAGVYMQTLQTANGCDSIVTLTLNVNPIYNTELTATICQGQTYIENGFNVSEAGVYTQNLQTVNGCDSIVTLTLNVNPIYNTELTATICQGQAYTENGFNVSEAGVYTQTLQTANGCDSIVTLTLNVNPIYNTELTATICQGQTYTENGFNVNEAGVYTQNLQTINGCDSIVTLTLNVNPIFNTELTATICEGQAYTENGFNVSEAGVYTQTLTSVNGCDSIVTLTVSVNPTFDTTINATINSGETYAEFGFNESESGTYVQNLQTVNGCDSTITLNLTVNSSLYDVAELAEITFYPNPTSGKVTFSKEIEKIEVIDNIGKVVMRFFDTKQINIETLPSGVYYLRLTIEDKITTRKVIKE